MSTQLAIRFPERTLAVLDGLVSAGDFANRAEAVRAAVEMLIRDAEHRAIDGAVVAGYRKVPDAAVDAWLDESTREMVSAEPW
jgi:Arc/MetJ-type ribon-helix-helix transcriptional regulator